MMGLTDRVGPWARRFQRAAADAPAGPAERGPARAGLPARRDDDAAAAARRTGRFTRPVLAGQEERWSGRRPGRPRRRGRRRLVREPVPLADQPARDED